MDRSSNPGAVCREEGKAGEVVGLKVHETLFPACLPVLPPQTDLEPERGCDQAHSGEEQPIEAAIEVEESQGDSGVQYKKIVGPLPEQADL